MTKLEYKENTVSLGLLTTFYLEMANAFYPALSTQVQIFDYVKKLHKNAKLFEAWADGQLVGLIACYANDYINKKSYITSVIVSPVWQGHKIASTLLKSNLDFLSKQKFKEVQLEVYQDNLSAKQLYKKNGFVPIGKHGNMIKMKLCFNNKQER